MVLKIVTESRDHPTAETVYQRARSIDSTISIGTVYRNLNLLSELGEISSLPMPQGATHYDFNTKCHAHFCCKICGCVTDVINGTELNEKVLSPFLPNCKVESCSLVFSGICPSCFKKNNGDKN